MNEIVNKFLLAGDKFMCEIHLNNQVLLIVLAVNLLNTKKEFKKKKKYVDRKYKVYLQE